MEDLINNAQTLLDASAALAEARIPTRTATGFIDKSDGIPYLVVPEGYAIRDLELLLPSPARKRANVVTTEAESFIAYVKKHGSLDECTLYAGLDAEKNSLSIIGLIDDHGADKPQWRSHRCQFAPRLSVEWSRWIGKNAAPMTQTEFAAWLEENLSDIATVEGMPSGAQILEMALGFEANADKKLRSKINLQSGGISLEFVDQENHDTRTTMQFFQRFTLGIPVFEGSGNAYPLEARLKYREKEGRLSFWYELIRPDRVFKTAAEDELKLIQGKTGFPLIYGRPE